MINTALLFAYEAHDGQKRKDGTPYILHPVEVGLELAKNDACDTLICAGFLHDTIEDTNITEETLRSLFPDEVTDLVMLDSEDKRLSWDERKKRALTSLETSGNKSYMMLMCADKLCNLRSVKKQHDIIGDRVWDMFRRGRDKQELFYKGLVNVLSPIADKPMYTEFKTIVESLFQ